MELHISLFGEKEEVLGWLELLEQEKLPFQYKGENLRNSSVVNILVGPRFSKKKTKILSGEKKVYILEPSPKNKRKNKADRIPKLTIEWLKNTLDLPENISSSLIKNNNERDKILDILRDVLIQAFNLVNLPYIHVWYYPQSCKTILLLRQDVDYVDQIGLKKLVDVTKKFKVRGTYFINISGEEEFDEEMGHLKLSEPTTPKRKQVLLRLIKQSNEIANHGYWHCVFRDVKNNTQNVKKCSQYLHELFNIKAEGFASPGGEWNKNLGKAIEKNGLLYACSGLSDGGFPYYPYLNSRKTKILEIPFYFFCDASLEQTNSPELMKLLRDYYLHLIQENINNGKPITIMGHPHLVGKMADIFYPPIFKQIKKSKIPVFTIGGFACWWKKRESINIKIYKKSNNQLEVKSNAANFFIESIFRKKRHLIKIHEETGKKFALGQVIR